MFRGGLIDIDGVLVDSEPLCYQAVRDTCRKYFGIELDREEYVRRYIVDQTSTPGIIKDYGNYMSLDEFRREKDKLLYRIIQEKLEMIPGTMEMLDNLRGLPLVAVTSAPREEACEKLGKFNLLERFKHIISVDESKETKSKSSRPYVMGVECIGVSPEKAFAVEDNPVGARSAKGAGCATIGYPNGFTLEMDFRDADITVTGLDQIGIKMLENLYRQTRKRT